MFKIIIKNTNSVITNTGVFLSIDLANQWKIEHEICFPIAYTYEIIDITAQLLAQQESDVAEKYLASTDFYIVRKAETGLDYAQSIKDARAAARLKVL